MEFSSSGDTTPKIAKNRLKWEKISNEPKDTKEVSS